MHLVIVDDELAIIECLKLLALAQEWQITGFSSPEELFNQFDSLTFLPDLFLVDQSFPGSQYTGEDCVKKIREKYPESPIILLTGDPFSLRTRESPDWDMVLEKPFSFQKLSNVMNKLGLCV